MAAAVPSGDDTAFLAAMESAERYEAWLADRCRPHLGGRVLDVGAGTGVLEPHFAAVCKTLVAVEPHEVVFEKLRRRVVGLANVTCVQADATALDLTGLGGPFDSVVCINVLEHLDDDEKALRRFRDYLADGGRLLLLVPAHPRLYAPMDRAVGHRRRYTKARLGGLLRQAGYEVDELRLVNPLGALGWLLAGRIGRTRAMPRGPLRVYDRLVPLLRFAERLELPFGLSVWAVARRR